MVRILFLNVLEKEMRKSLIGLLEAMNSSKHEGNRTIRGKRLSILFVCTSSLNWSMRLGQGWIQWITMAVYLCFIACNKTM
jgi:hypothetical protein